MRRFATRSCRVRRERRRQVLCRHYPLPTWKVWQTSRCPNWGLWQRSRQTDPPCCAEGMGTHQGLEQGVRARSKGSKGRRGPRTLQDAGRRHTGVPEHQDVAEGVHPHQLPQATGEPGHRGHPCDHPATRTGMGQRWQGESQSTPHTYRGQGQLRPNISGAEGPGTGTGLRDPRWVDATQSEPSNQAEGRRDQAPPSYPVGTGARTAGSNSPELLLRARSVGRGISTTNCTLDSACTNSRNTKTRMKVFVGSKNDQFTS